MLLNLPLGERLRNRAIGIALVLSLLQIAGVLAAAGPAFSRRQRRIALAGAGPSG